VPIRFRAASNPPRREDAARGAWVKERYVNPLTRADGVVFIPAKISDNPFLDAEDYFKSLTNLDPVTQAQLMDGDWEVEMAGGMCNPSLITLIDKPLPNIYASVRYWDLAGTKKEKDLKKALGEDDRGPAYTAGVLMSKTLEGFYVIEHVKRDRLDPDGVETMIRQTAELDGKEPAVRIEQDPGQAGKAQIDNYRRYVLPGWDFDGAPTDSKNKITRFRPFAAQVGGGNIYMVRGAWNQDYLDELLLFPDGLFKDQADATSGAYNHLALQSVPRVRSIG
jgi:predicted phage terminase large subunit-like protein